MVGPQPKVQQQSRKLMDSKQNLLKGQGCSSVGRASDRHTTDAGSVLQSGKGFFSQSQLALQTLS